MTPRGVVYIAWERAPAEHAALLERAVASLRAVHPELPHEVVRLPGIAPHLETPRLPALTPFATTAYLEADTVVLDRLDFGFEMAERYGVACCHGENPWRRRYVGLRGDAAEYDTGVLFFGAGAGPLFEAWQGLAPSLHAPVGYVEDGQARTVPRDDRLAFGHAVEASGLVPLVLPCNWNLRPTQRRFFGPVKIWHDRAEVPPLLREIVAYYREHERDAIIQFHALDRPPEPDFRSLVDTLR